MEIGRPTRTIAMRTWIVVGWIIVFSNGALFFVARRFFDRPGTWEGPVLRPAIVLSIGLAVAMVVLDGERRSSTRLRAVPAVPLVASIAFGAWATLTTFWSLEPDTTLWRGVGYTFLPFVAWVIADLGPEQWRRALALGTGLLVTVGLAVAVFVPRWGTDQNDDWRGLMTNRNGFGPICALAVFAGVALVAEGRRRTGGALIVVSLIALLGTGSRTAWLALAIALGVASVVVVARRLYLQQGRSSIIVGAGGVLAAGGAVTIGAIATLWNEPTFAQRRTIWDLVGEHIADAPIIGTGWAAFWHHPELHTDPLLQRGSAHGAVPELLLGGGLVALTLWLVVVVAAVAGVGRRTWREPDNEAWLWLAVVSFLLVENLTESFVLWFSYNWILLIAAALRFGALRRPASVRPPESIGELVG